MRRRALRGRSTLAAAATAVALAAPADAAATSVLVLTLHEDRVQLLVDDRALRTLRPGESSPEGVTVLVATPYATTLLVDGEPVVLRAGERNDAGVTLFADRDRLFRTRVFVNGAAATGIIDTGATVVRISRPLAADLGIDYLSGRRAKLSTVVGQVPGFLVILRSVRIGGIELANVPGVVADTDSPDFAEVLIGASFLSRVQLDQQGNRLTLSPPR